MKNIRLVPFIITLLCAVISLPLLFGKVHAQATANPPGKVVYQGFLSDAAGLPYGSNTPVNLPVIFRIFNASTGGTNLWTEQQTVTIDKGHFSVLFGEGSAVGSEPTSANLSTIFVGESASDRFIQLSVDGTLIMPRMQCLSAPYSMLAMNARAMVDSDGNTLVNAVAGKVGIGITNPDHPLDVAGIIQSTGLNVVGPATFSDDINAASFSGNGASLLALNAAQITTGILPDARLSGTYSSAVTFNNKGNTLYGNGANLTALNAANINSGTLADARLSTFITGGATLAGAATSDNTASAIVKRDANGDITIRNMTATAITADSITTRAITTTETINGILPPYVIKIGIQNNTTTWTSAIIPSAIVEKYLGGPNGGTMRINMMRNSDKYALTVEEKIYISQEPHVGLASVNGFTRQLGGGESAFALKGAGSWEVIPYPWGYIYCRNYHSPQTAPYVQSGPYTDYTLELLVIANVSATVVLYNY